MSSRILRERDPVCTSIESLLHDLEAQGLGTFETRSIGESVEVSFGNIKATAMDRDIALVRLARLMMDDTRYWRMIVEAVKTPLHEND